MTDPPRPDVVPADLRGTHVPRLDRERTALAAAYAHGPGKSVRAPARAVHPVRNRAAHTVALSALADIPSFGPALVRALTAALAPRRWEPWNAHNDHRAYPSPRCAYLADTALRIAGQRWAVDPVRLRLEGEGQLQRLSAVSSVTVELTVDPG
jgi:hypothetical protein